MKTIEQLMANEKFVASLAATRTEARKRGANIYFTREPCVHGHVVYRKVRNGACAKCQSLLSAGRIRQMRDADPEGFSARRAVVNAKWNASEKGLSAKQKWKLRDPKWAWAVSAVGGARARARERELPFDLTNDYIYELAPTHCPALGCELLYFNPRTGKKHANLNQSATIDRINPTKGYVVGNVAVISHRANAVKSDATSDDLRKIADWIDRNKDRKSVV